ncbi:Protein VAC14-like protein [Psilocybe cubensis]|uniref:Protein VAC14-like protein n=2 Tax=Psilocybe cubensis TaxID=181762 RepID=A0ACB8H3N9_PSICU|nr:Protein VAC14-like protein [Psilocybe cubensis]KAH9482513.1 Protein VAC14-like protein [Psilocybe cubensis]
MDTAIARQLIDKIYEKRKAAALELERQIRECAQQGEQKRISQIIDQLVEMFNNASNPLHIRNGGLIGLAGTAIALGVDIAPYMEKFVGPLLDCFVDPENRIRYFSAECLYNIAKVSKGEVLVYFNAIFDALSKLAADSELSVKNGAELLDRLLKDIVAESASVYIPLYPETEKVRDEREELPGVLVPLPDSSPGDVKIKKAFSLAHFIPLLRERIYVVSPFTRSYLVSWISVLDSVPELELITYLPEFLDGLLKYLSDPTEDVRVATENLLADFLRELRDVTIVSRQLNQQTKSKAPTDSLRKADVDGEKLPDLTRENAERALYMLENDEHRSANNHLGGGEDYYSDEDDRDIGAWIPGQGVRVDYAAIIEILLEQLENDHDEIQQSTALRWLAEFLTFAHEVMIPFTPRLLTAILPNLAHHAVMIQSAAIRTNKLLQNVIQKLPSPQDPPPHKPPVTEKSNLPTRTPRSPEPVPIASTSTNNPTNSRQSTLSSQNSRETSSPELTLDSNTSYLPTRGRPSNADLTLTPRPGQPAEILPTAGSRPHSPVSFASSGVNGNAVNVHVQEDADPFDYQKTVDELTVQFLSEFEETRVAALKWMIMLHQKTPKKNLAMDDGTFPALLKILSDSSEEVIKHDLQLLAQISSSSEESYFKVMMNLLGLFSTDRSLLETRGSLIIRQLCLNLNTEKIYRTFAEIIEKEDAKFASVIVQKLNIILITSPELADFRKRLKSVDTRQDGQALFTTLYRSWCHNAVSVFSLCLLAQAYEHASNLLYIFADLEITVPMLVQIDKLVQLIESPVFTYIRLQLLEPEKYPHLFKCLYGILMLLPQSSAFVSLRNRLNAVNSAGFLQIAPKSNAGSVSGRSKLGRDEIKWQDLLLHFRTVQARHEKARRQALGNDNSPITGFPEDRIGETPDKVGKVASPGARPPMRRRVTGDVSMPNIIPMPPAPSRAGALSPLNPKSRGAGGLTSLMGSNNVPNLSPNLNPAAALTLAQKQRRPPLELNRK